MRNFQKIADGIDTIGLTFMLNARPDLWNKHRLRQDYPGSPHSEVDDIWLRFQDETLPPEKVIDAHESVNYIGMRELQMVRPIIFGLMRQVEGERLGRVIITRLAPSKKIYRHIDGGDHAAYYKRFQLMIQCSPKVVFRCGDEQAEMKTGDLWWFDNSKEHEVINDSDTDRIVMIMDIRPCI